MEVYDAGAVTVSVAGIPLDRAALGSGDAISFEMSGPNFTIKKGIGGGASRARQYPHGILKLKVRQTSSFNTKLSAVHTLDLATSVGAGVVPVVLKDRNGTHTMVETEAFLAGWPTVPYGAEEGDVEWEIICPDPTQFVGGH